MTTTPGTNDALAVTHICIRRRRTAGATGDVSVASTVYCPKEERSIALDECTRCSQFHALHAGVDVLETTVSCRSEEALPLREAHSELPHPGTPVAEVMTSDVICLCADVGLDDALRILVERGFGAMPVVDDAGRPIGVFSKTDVARLSHERGDTNEVISARPREREGHELGPGFHVVESSRVTVGEVMTPLALSLQEGASVGQAAALMAFEGIHQLPIVADDGRVVGILAALDVLRWFGRRSGYLVPKGPREPRR